MSMLMEERKTETNEKTTVPSMGMVAFARALTANWDSVERFLSDPRKFTESMPLTNEEREAILARDVRTLVGIGWDRQLTIEVMSGAHSQQCSTTGN